VEYRTTEKTDLNSGVKKVMKKERIKKIKLWSILRVEGSTPFSSFFSKKFLSSLFKVFVIAVLVLIVLFIVILVMISSFFSEWTYIETPNKANTITQRKVYEIRHTGKKPSQTARIILYDHKFGRGAVDKAKSFGDSFIGAFKTESQNYQLVTGPVAVLLVDILSANKTAKSIAEASEMYKMPKTIHKLVGAAVLAKFDLLGEDEFQSGGLIYNILTNKNYLEMYDARAKNSRYIELALQAVANTKAINMVPHIIKFLEKRPSPYRLHAKVCDVLLELKAMESIPALIEAMESEEFYALDEAFNALILLGEEKAIPLAISRIVPEKEGMPPNSLITELERYTGQAFGTNKEAWEQWWYEKN